MITTTSFDQKASGNKQLTFFIVEFSNFLTEFVSECHQSQYNMLHLADLNGVVELWNKNCFAQFVLCLEIMRSQRTL